MADSSATRALTIEDREEAVILFGPRDQHLRSLRDALGVRAVYRGGELRVEGPPDAADPFLRAIDQLRQIGRKTGQIGPKDVSSVLEVVRGGTSRGGGSVVAT